MTQILHLTNVANLTGIIRAGGLWCPNRLPTNVVPSSSAHAGIQQRRAACPVPVGPGGVLHDYVPFYFGERSPMLIANHGGLVASNPAGQQPLVYIVSTVEAVTAAGLQWVFTDGHAIMRLTRFFDTLAALRHAVDWQAVHARYWNDTPAEPDRKRKKQAEFLVHGFFPLELVTGIAVIDQGMRQQVEQLVAPHGWPVPVSVRPDWYY
jgi:ssDNA thymidine ADP-ribosyltransferase, DarT